MSGLLVLLALPAFLTAPATAQSDLNALLRDAQRQQKKLEAIRRDYTYTEVQEQDILDSKGNVKEHLVAKYDVTYVGPQRIRRLVGRQGQALTPAEDKHEMERVEKEVKKAQNREAKDPEGDDDSQTMMNSFLRIMRLTNPRHGELHGRSVTICNFERDPAAKSKDMQEKVLLKVSGTIWIDDATRTIARFEGRLDQGVRLGGGILFSLHEGSDFSLEQVRVNDEIWFPSVATVHVQGRVLLAGMRRNITVRNSNFQRFRVNSSSVIAAPAAQ
jgi:hypothetical protein